MPSPGAAQAPGGDQPRDDKSDDATTPNTARRTRPVCSGQNHAIDGHVVDAITHEPIAGASVAVDGETVALTDQDGRFALNEVCPGEVTVEAGRADYQTGRATVPITGVNRPASVELTLEPALGEVIVIEAEAPPPIDTRSTAQVSGEALERTRGRSFSDTLADVPGVSQLRSANGLAKPIVRGQFGRRLLLLVDGMRHRSQEWGLDHAPEIDPFIADQITVVRGAAGVRYGPDAIGGAVLVEPPHLLRSPGVAGEAHAIGSSIRGGSLAGRLQFAPGQLPGLAGQVEVSAKRLAAPSTPDYALDNTGTLEANGGGTIGYRRGGDEYRLSYRHYAAQLGVCSCLRIESSDDFFAQLDRNEPIDAELYRSDFEIERQYQAVAHDSALARASWRLQPVGRLTASYGLQYDHRQEFAIVRDATGPQFDFRLTTHDADVQLEHNPQHISDHLHLRGSAGLVGTAQQHSYSGLPLVPDHRAWSGGGYAIERLVGHDFEAEAGVRYDVLTRSAAIVRRDFLRLVRSDQLAIDACGDSDADPVTCDSTFHTLSASVGGVLRIARPWSLKLNLATASRAPNPDEQYLNGTSPTLPVLGLGKPDLAPETTYSGSLTSSFQREDIAAEVSVFANYTADYIYFAPAVDDQGEPIFDVLIRGTFPRFVTRPVDATFYGVDGGIAYDVLPFLQLAGQVSAVRARNLTDDSFLVFVPPDRVRGSVTYTRGTPSQSNAVFASVAGTLVARQDRVDLAADLAPPPEAYFLLGAEVGWATNLGDQRLKIAAQGSNLLNTRYRDYTSLLRYFADQPGLQLLLRVTVQFSTDND